MTTKCIQLLLQYVTLTWMGLTLHSNT